MLEGRLDSATRQLIAGWARDRDWPEVPVSLVITADDLVIARVLANRYRADLAQASIGDGRFSFDFQPGGLLSPIRRYEIAVRREGDGAHLPGSPVALEPLAVFDDLARAGIAQMLSAIDDEAGLEQSLVFLEDQMDRLRQRRAEERSGVAARRALRRLAWQEPDVSAAAVALRPGEAPRPRALVIDETMPDRTRDAGSNAILSHMQALRRIGFDVSFAPADLDGDDAALASEGVDCFCRPWCDSVEEILKRLPGVFALVYLHRGEIAARYAALARHYQPEARILYSVADLKYLRLARQADVEQRPELRILSRRSHADELTAARIADAVITHSAFEASLLQRQVSPDKVHTIPWVIAPRPPTIAFADRWGVAFVGGYAHVPNVDAALWMAEKVMPEIRSAKAAIPCLLVGSNMPEVLRRLAGPDIEPIGFVPDVSDVYRRVRLTAAPLAYGAGVKGKVLDSLAAGLPCVCTPIAAEGLDLPVILRDQIAATPAEFAAKVIRLHDDESLNRRCAEAGLAFVESFASQDNVDKLLKRAALALPTR